MKLRKILLCTFTKGVTVISSGHNRDGSRYYLLLTAEMKSNYTFQLFLFTSLGGIYFNNMQRIYPNNDKTLWENVSFYRSTFFIKDYQLNLYIIDYSGLELVYYKNCIAITKDK